jgi:putative ABC transport system permease protein
VVPIGVGLLLAVLIAFNSSTIGADERTRENATMFAFGLSPRAPIGIAMGESLVVGVIGTVIGLGLGVLLLGWIVNVQFPDVVPEVGARVVLSPGTFGWAALAGIVAVALAPLLTYPRVRRMDVPASLRVME